MLSLKRCRNGAVSACTRSKRPRLVGALEHARRRTLWISATHTRNYMRNDALVDWLKHIHRTGIKGYTGAVSQRDPFPTFIMNKGVEFERNLVDYIRSERCDIVTVADKITPSTCRKTIRLMKEGVPVLHSAPFVNYHTRTRGIIDLLVRSDCLGDLIDQNPLSPEQQTIKAPNLNGDYHYVVIDVKFSTLPLRADGTHLLNSDSFPAYKSQLYIYNQGIGEIQGYFSQCSYILGRRWRYTSKKEKYHGLNCLDRLGVVNFEGVDTEYVQRTKDAIQWLKDLRNHGRGWSVNPPTRDELRPNMCVDSGVWNKTKHQIAIEIADVTQIWYCGVKHRNNALRQGIESWKDERCTSAAMGMNGIRAVTIDKILDINRQDVDKIRPAIIESNTLDWKTCTNKTNEMFVDFETFCDVFSDQEKTDHIFMIGLWYRNDELQGSRRWEYKTFIAETADSRGEFDIMNKFTQFVNARKVNGIEPKLWYWHAETMIWERALCRQYDAASSRHDYQALDHIGRYWDLSNWADLCKVFRNEPIVLKGCFKFGLKEVANAMRTHGMISAHIESKCDSGLTAAVKAWNAYQETDDPINDPTIRDIAKYNEFDVKVLHEMLQYLRDNHQ